MRLTDVLCLVSRRYDFALVPNQTINMTTGATIHTTDGLYMTLKERCSSAAGAQAPAAASTAGA